MLKYFFWNKSTRVKHEAARRGELMSWDYERSKNRLAAEWERVSDSEYTVTRMTREMNLNSLANTDVRQVFGVHLYAEIANVEELLEDPQQRRDDYRRIYRTLHLTRKELRRILQSVFCGDKIQVQGAKFHGLLFRPYNDPEVMATNAVLAALSMDAALTSAFGEVFPSYPELVLAIGLDLGDALVANIGMRGDRELLSVGNAANNAAKILIGNRISVGTTLYDALPTDLQDWFIRDGEQYRLDPSTVEDLEALIKDEGFTWTLQSSINNLADEADALPLTDIAIEDVREKIDIARLGPRLAKTCNAATIFTDMDGYTSMVDSLDEDNDELIDAVKLLHLFRYELRRVTEDDYAAISVQHHGDRLQALLHDPSASDDDDVRQAAVDLAIAYNSSVEEVINEEHDDILGKIHVAIGCAYGKTLVGKLGTKGDMDPVVVGKAAVRAEDLQTKTVGNDLSITPKIFEAITDEEIRAAFIKEEAGHYKATGITYPQLEATEATAAYKTATSAAYTASGSISIGVRDGGIAALRVTRPYAP
jgi:class 3 adenylate cyclase